MRRIVAVVLVLCLLPLPSAAQPIPPAERLRRARACLAALDQPCAESEVAEARASVDALSPADRLALLRLEAEVSLSAGRLPEAARRLVALLEADPAFEPPPGAWPAGWRAELDRVRAGLPDGDAPVLEVEVPAALREGEAAEVRVRATDRSGVGEVLLGLAGPEPRQIPLATSDGRTWRATVPAADVRRPDLSLWVEARDLKGNGPARWGSPADPQRLPVAPPAPPPRRPLVKQWWFWTVIGVAAAGTGVGLYYLGRGQGGPGTRDSGPGRLDVEVRWPSPSD